MTDTTVVIDPLEALRDRLREQITLEVRTEWSDKFDAEVHRASRAVQAFAMLRHGITEQLRLLVSSDDLDLEVAKAVAVALDCEPPLNKYTVRARVTVIVTGVQAENAGEAELLVQENVTASINNVFDMEDDTFEVDYVSAEQE